jgi:hypothetical protein
MTEIFMLSSMGRGRCPCDAEGLPRCLGFQGGSLRPYPLCGIGLLRSGTLRNAVHCRSDERSRCLLDDVRSPLPVLPVWSAPHAMTTPALYLGSHTGRNYDKGRPVVWQVLWHLASHLFFQK